MFGTIARIVMMRYLPRRLLPVLAAWQVISALRGGKRQSTQQSRVIPGSARRIRSR
jgi:hypothetical protein